MKLKLMPLFISLLLLISISVTSAKSIDSKDPKLKNMVDVLESVKDPKKDKKPDKIPDITGIEILPAVDGSGGIWIIGTGDYAHQITISISQSKIKKLKIFEQVRHIDEAGIETLPFILVSDDKKGNYVLTIELSSVCIGCYTGTATVISTNLTNGSIMSLGQTFNSANVSNLTVNYTVQGRNLTTARDGVNTTGLVLSARFDNTTGTFVLDSSGSGNNGTMVGFNTGMNNCTGNCSGWTNTSSKINNALAFDGVNDYVDAGNAASLNNVFGSEIFTLEAWVYPKEWVNYRGIINKRTSVYYSASPGSLFSDATGIAFIIGTGNEGETSANINYKPTLNNWHHIAGTAQRINSTHTNMTLYVDGVIRGSALTTFDPLINNNATTIGAFYASYRVFNGSIDEVRIYNRSLNATEILQNYYLRPDLINASTNSNTSIGSFNTTVGTAVNIPFASTDAAIINVSFRVPATCTVGTDIIYDCANTSNFNATVMVGYTENTTTLQESSNNGIHTMNISIQHANNGTGNIGQQFNDIPFLLANTKGTVSMISNNINATVSRNVTHYNINEGLINSSSTYTYNLTDSYSNLVGNYHTQIPRLYRRN